MLRKGRLRALFASSPTAGASNSLMSHPQHLYAPDRNRRGISGQDRPDVADRIAFWVALLLVLALTAWTYQPGLHGIFLFDDFANLPALGIRSCRQLDYLLALHHVRYADLTGRLLALLSFLIDAHDWPADLFLFSARASSSISSTAHCWSCCC
jgi:hypothetical protein